MRKDRIIYESLVEANKGFFNTQSIHLDLLKNRPHTISTLVQWIYDDWHTFDASLTKDKLIQSFNERLNADIIPITFVALRNDEPIGVISLKYETDPIFADFPKDSLWMGSLHVLPEERDQGLDQELLKYTITVAKRLGYEKLYFYISNPAQVKWYAERGAQVIEQRPFRDHVITIMQIPLKFIENSRKT